MPADPIKRLSTGEHVALHVRQLIFDGVLRPGERIPQDEIAKSLGVSRIPVREGLIALEHEGWLTTELHRGAFVATLDRQAVIDHYALFGVIYGFAARRAIEHARTALLSAALAPILKQMDNEADPGRFTRLVVDFHRQVVEQSISSRIALTLRGMALLVPGDFMSTVPEAMISTRRTLAAVAAAIGEGDIDAAIAAYNRMSAEVAELVADLLEQRGLLGDPVATTR